MSFLSPLLLAGLAALPVIWLLLRATPPAPRTQSFPPIALLERLQTRREDARRAPLWLLLLRMIALGCVIVGFAQPVIMHEAHNIAANGTTLILIDNGWAASVGWNRRISALDALSEHISRAGGRAILLRTAPDYSGHVGQPTALLHDRDLLAAINALSPEPWSVDRAATATILGAANLPPVTRVIYLADGLATPGDGALAAALHRIADIQEIRVNGDAPMVLTAHLAEDGTYGGHVITLADPHPRRVTVRAQTGESGTLATSTITIAPGSTQGDFRIDLPSEIRNQIDQLSIDGYAQPSALHLLDEGDQRRPAGLISTGGSDTPLVGSLFYLRRALAPSVDLHEGDLDHLLASPLSVLIATDGTLGDPTSRQKIMNWIRKGGTLIRFAGPLLARQDDHDPTASDIADALLPVALVDGARQLGGPMSWGKPQALAAFDQDSVFHDLMVPPDVTISRQVLAQPSPDLAERSWARLTDGTPLVTHRAEGDGQIVLFHVTSAPDWSNLPLSGLFVSMLQRLIDSATGLRTPGDDTVLAPMMTLDGDAVLGPPPPGARGLVARAFGTTPASPLHPPGLYGPRDSRRALNLGDTITSLHAQAPIGTLSDATLQRPATNLGPGLLVIGLSLLMIDAVISLALRGALRRFGMVAILLVATHAGAQAQSPTPDPATAPARVPGAALETRLAFISSGHDDVDNVARQGLQGLSDYVNARTSAVLGHPDAITPEHDDLSYYPLLYWPVTADATTNPQRIAALNTYMSHGGILLIDTQGRDPSSSSDNQTSFAQDAPGTAQALRRITAGLSIPPLMALDDKHVLAHTFYLLHDFPGRYAGQKVWVAREGDAANDGVSPVIIGAADWAHAWAVDANGDTPFAVIPDGQDQRQTAYRFGVNAVIYALTGNYKADQVHVPALLHRLGQ